jgi:two-component system, LytTR family, response regulator
MTLSGKTSLRVLVADDERLSRYALRALLETLDDVVVVAECADGAAALDAIRRERPDLVFLDIEMPRLGGIDVVDRLDATGRPAVIFVTAYDEHAVRAFEVRAVDYVLKPFDERRLAEAVEHARTRLREHAAAEHVEDVLGRLEDQLAGTAETVRRLVVRDAGRAYFVATTDIDWIEAVDSHVHLHAGGVVHAVRARIGELEHRLDRSRFMRIHRSTIVNLDRVQHVEPYGGSDYQVVMRDGTRLRVSRSCRDRLLRDG